MSLPFCRRSVLRLSDKAARGLTASVRHPLQPPSIRASHCSTLGRKVVPLPALSSLNLTAPSVTNIWRLLFSTASFPAFLCVCLCLSVCVCVYVYVQTY